MKKLKIKSAQTAKYSMSISLGAGSGHLIHDNIGAGSCDLHRAT